MSLKLTDQQKALIKKDLINAGAIQREKPLTPRDSYYSKSIGKTNTTPAKVRI
ncbi:hypothetical protein MKY59_30640 [Paenibacillus sp. FSL W8-0426]|uniref:hypothetical protein n=1 Tax=Paenibacillus sp. FSL W8-0426 TaxID=2921714 RepID=UPI0030DCBDDD